MRLSHIHSYYYSQRGRGYSEEIAAGDALLINPVKTRAYYDFTTLSGDEDDALTSHSDLTGNGWSLNDSTGTLTPKLGKVQRDTEIISCLKANTASGVKNAFITTAPSTNLLKGSHEIFMTLVITDGQIGVGWYLMGARDGGTRIHDVFVTSTGAIQIRYAAGATGMSTIATTTGIIPDGVTGIMLIRVKMDFVNDVITVYVNGAPYTTTVSSGNALSVWNPANWISSRACGIGGSWDGAFAADGANQYKNIIKLAVTETLTDSEATNVSLSMLDL